MLIYVPHGVAHSRVQLLKENYNECIRKAPTRPPVLNVSMSGNTRGSVVSGNIPGWLQPSLVRGQQVLLREHNLNIRHGGI